MKSQPMLMVVAGTIVWLSTLSLWAQGGSPGSQPSAASAPSASQGSATIENQMIAYEVLRQMAGQIAARASGKVCKGSCEKEKRGAALLADPTAMIEIVSAKSFDTSASALCAAYQPSPSPCDKLAPVVATAQAFSDTTTAVAGLLTAIRSTATYSNQNFQPTSQSMINLLSSAMNDVNIDLRTSALPGDLDGAMKDVQRALSIIAKAQSASPATVRPDVDKEFSAFRTALTGTSPDGTVLATIIKGKALLNSLGANYSILTVSVDAAGGDTKVTHFFWQELIMPTPSPSYNGGAVVSFLLTDPAGKFQDGDIFHYMYDFSKWKSPKVPKTFNSDQHLQR